MNKFQSPGYDQTLSEQQEDGWLSIANNVPGHDGGSERCHLCRIRFAFRTKAKSFRKEELKLF